jgi:hypothetical protein
VNLRRIALVLVPAVLAVVPRWLEREAVTRVDARLGRCDRAARCGGVAALDIDARGLVLVHPWRVARGARLGAERVRVRPTWDAIEVDVEGPSIERVAEEPSATVAEPAQRPTSSIDARRPTPPLAVRVQVHGAIEWKSGRVELELRDPSLRVDRSGDLSLEAVVAIAAGPLRARSIGPARATAAVADGDRVLVEGTFDLGGDPLRARATIAREVVVATAWHEGGGRLDARVDGWTDPRREGAALRVDAQDFPLAALGVSAPLAERGVSVEHARVSGGVEAERTEGVRLRLSEVVVRGASLDDRRLARGVVELARARIDGEIELADGRVNGELALAHGGAALTVGGAWDGNALELHADLPETRCQVLLDALPRGFADTLAGARLSGSVGGTFRLAVTMGELDRALASIENPEAPLPGQVRIDFPFLERCGTLEDPPSIDLAGLRGAYRHRTIVDGHERVRVMAAGADGYVTLESVPRLAAAFVALEDTGFWSHDGFDRDQIERAFWFNLVNGGVRRGASTLTQQTARNLWLGVDRSLSRKVQEAWLTARLEAHVPKARILELYVNLVELGPGVFGVADAAHFHFGKPASELDLLEALHLASLAPAPRSLSRRFASGEVDQDWLAELRGHADRMMRFGHAPELEAARAMRRSLTLLRRK